MGWSFPILRPDFEHLIPHAGDMCLLVRVVAASTHAIRCEADSHLDPANPLRNASGLPVTAGIEYAAQAMALHAALHRGGAGAVQGGVIAVLSEVTWRNDWLHTTASTLRVEASLLAETGQGRQYRFEVGASGDAPLIAGAMIIALA